MHSTEAYLKRTSTPKLEQFLRQCEHGKMAKEYAYILPEIRRILEQRRHAEKACEAEPAAATEMP